MARKLMFGPDRYTPEKYRQGIIRRGLKVWTDFDNKRLAAMLKFGKRDKEIAQELDRTLAAVRVQIYRLGLRKTGESQ